MADVSGHYVLRATDAYEAYMGRWSRPLAEAFLAWFAVPTAGRWLDVGCGTGALTEAVLDATDPIAVVGIDPSPEFLGAAQRHVSDPRARFEIGDARALPVASDGYDAVVAGLVLNFVPDPALAVAEMVRAARPGGAVGAYVWDYRGADATHAVLLGGGRGDGRRRRGPRSASALPHLPARAAGGPVSRGRTGRRGGRRDRPADGVSGPRRLLAAAHHGRCGRRAALRVWTRRRPEGRAPGAAAGHAPLCRGWLAAPDRPGMGGAGHEATGLRGAGSACRMPAADGNEPARRAGMRFWSNCAQSH